MPQEFVVYCYTSDAPRIILFEICPSDDPEDWLTQLRLDPDKPQVQTALDQSYLAPLPAEGFTNAQLIQRSQAVDLLTTLQNTFEELRATMPSMTVEQIVSEVEQAAGLTVEVVR